jgi:high-affinity nickel-transport protein
MSLMDTSDAVLMSKAYSWSADNPLRGSFYNLLVTGLSVGIALTVGGIELLRVFTPFAGAAWWPGRLMKHVGSWAVGVTVVAVFAAVWVTAAIVLGRRRGKLTGSTLRS